MRRLGHICMALVLLSIASYSCRKKELRTDIDVVEPQTDNEHCYNWIMDEDEVGTDCGGSCSSPCSSGNAPCTTADLTMSVTTLGSTTVSELSIISAGVNGNGIYEINYESNDGNALTIFFDSKPNAAVIYSLSNGVSSTKAAFKFLHDGIYVDTSSNTTGVLYLSDSNGSLVIQACSVELSEFVGFGFRDYSISFKVTK